ncbi:MAG: malto-oligosyltrehalose trehalohydrolase [Verrucomicrobia bacterium]|nr:malto-oligosyltrehalose trehalohydrolase [Verrucomicrobiota bacterium]
MKHHRRMPIGAEVQKGGGTHFRVWSTTSSELIVCVSSDPELKANRLQVVLTPEEKQYFSGYIPEAKPGDFYKFIIGGRLLPDPAARAQHDGPHGPSIIVDPDNYTWHDEDWGGVSLETHVIYEMHLGTFTHAGTWAGARERISYLKELGIDVVEIMPIADFTGNFGWGYDGVCLFAPCGLYGERDEAKRFIDECHQAGLAVILDVVYNHVGPDGNYLPFFSPAYFSERYQTEWGKPFNFDGPDSGPVREFFVENAKYWVREFHFDGFRLDATQQIFDASPRHVLAEISAAARETAGNRRLYLVAENEPQCVKLVQSPEEGGYGLDSVWNDDFHHSAIVALTGRAEAYYCDYQGYAQEFLSAAKWGFLYQGQYYSWQKQNRGTWAVGLSPGRFVNFIQNHDQVANSLAGHRIHTLAGAGAVRAMTTLLLLGPWTPMLFQGEEFAAATPFLYFADQPPEIAAKVAEGRAEFLKQFPSLSSPEVAQHLPNPGDQSTFTQCKLNFADLQTNEPVYLLHKHLIALRRSDPVINGRERHFLDGTVYGPHLLILRYFGLDSGNDRLMMINFDRDQVVSPAPIPLLAAPPGRTWEIIFSSEDPQYAGQSAPAIHFDERLRIAGYSATVLRS